MMLCAILATIILDSLINRPVPASITTLLPGFAYGTALIMKVCLAEGVVAAVIALASRKRQRENSGLAAAAVIAPDDSRKHQVNIPDTSTKLPVWSILAV